MEMTVTQTGCVPAVVLAVRPERPYAEKPRTMQVVLEVTVDDPAELVALAGALADAQYGEGLRALLRLDEMTV